MIYWITGKRNAGKTVYAERLAKELREKGHQVAVFDGDAVRDKFPTGFSDAQRHDHIIRIARFAAVLEEQGIIVIIALVSPNRKWREEARALFRESILVYIPGGDLWEGTTYEEPNKEELNIRGVPVCVKPHDEPDKEAYSLVIGRFQPFHDGHVAMVKHLLNEGRKVLIAIRDGDISERNPYTFEEREQQIKEKLNREYLNYKIIKIPDINEVVFGRRVGWGIREIRLDEEMEAISATDIRKQTKPESLRCHVEPLQPWPRDCGCDD